MKYEGTKAFQLYFEESSIKATLVFESDIEDELRTFLTARKDLGGCVFRQRDPATGEFKFHKLRPLKRRPNNVKPLKRAKNQRVILRKA